MEQTLKLLSAIINDDRESLNLAPTGAQFALLQENGINLSGLPLDTWYQYMLTGEIDGYSSILFGSLDSAAKRAQFSDLVRRTQIIVNEYLNNPDLRGITFLDGHGRTLFLLYHHLKLANFTNLHGVQRPLPELRIVEYTKVVYDWHTLVFPNSIINVLGDIYDYYKPSDTSRGRILYLNFCGLPRESHRSLTLFFEHIIYDKRIEDFDTSPVYISFLQGAEGQFRNIKKCVTAILKACGNEISRRVNFVTYRLDSSLRECVFRSLPRLKPDDFLEECDIGDLVASDYDDSDDESPKKRKSKKRKSKGATDAPKKPRGASKGATGALKKPRVVAKKREC